MFTTCVKYTGQSDRNHQVGKAAEVTCDKSSLLGLNEEHFNVVSQRAQCVCSSFSVNIDFQKWVFKLLCLMSLFPLCYNYCHHHSNLHLLEMNTDSKIVCSSRQIDEHFIIRKTIMFAEELLYISQLVILFIFMPALVTSCFHNLTSHSRATCCG